MPGIAAPSEIAEKLSEGLFLAHSTSPINFEEICKRGQLSSKAEQAMEHGHSLSGNHHDVLNGTENSVFLYAGPFRYSGPGLSLSSSCGLLFAPSLETMERENGSASGFDSGGLGNPIQYPGGYSSARSFLEQHAMPIPEHREYLRLAMDNLFDEPKHYVDGTGPKFAGSLGLSGGDARRWTHEVRIPSLVKLLGGHLQAVFAPWTLVQREPAYQELFELCALEGIDTVPTIAYDFLALQRACFDYLRLKRLY